MIRSNIISSPSSSLLLSPILRIIGQRYFLNTALTTAGRRTATTAAIFRNPRLKCISSSLLFSKTITTTSTTMTMNDRQHQHHNHISPVPFFSFSTTTATSPPIIPLYPLSSPYNLDIIPSIPHSTMEMIRQLPEVESYVLNFLSSSIVAASPSSVSSTSNEKSIEELKRASKIFSQMTYRGMEHRAILKLIGQCYYENGQYEKAKETLEIVYSYLDPKKNVSEVVEVEVYYLSLALSKLEWFNGCFEKALQYAKDAEQITHKYEEQHVNSDSNNDNDEIIIKNVNVNQSISVATEMKRWNAINAIALCRFSCNSNGAKEILDFLNPIPLLPSLPFGKLSSSSPPIIVANSRLANAMFQSNWGISKILELKRFSLSSFNNEGEQSSSYDNENEQSSTANKTVDLQSYNNNYNSIEDHVIKYWKDTIIELEQIDEKKQYDDGSSMEEWKQVKLLSDMVQGRIHCNIAMLLLKRCQHQRKQKNIQNKNDNNDNDHNDNSNKDDYKTNLESASYHSKVGLKLFEQITKVITNDDPLSSISSSSSLFESYLHSCIGYSLGLAASCHALVGSAVTAEGLFLSAIDRYHPNPNSTMNVLQYLELKHIYSEYAVLLDDWEKREGDAKRMRDAALKIDSTCLPKAWVDASRNDGGDCWLSGLLFFSIGQKEKHDL